jgi:sodium/hydrogen antiporter
VPADALPAYAFTLALLGLALFGAAWLPHALRDKALPFPLLYVLIGLVLYGIPWPWPLPLPRPDPIEHGELLERLAELAVIISLMSVGLRIDTRFGWRRWSLTWRLLAVTMPLSIAAGAWLGMLWLDLGLAAAVLLGAVLAPTDPVLAADVQVAPPGQGGEDPVRFALTSEAGLNDALAFPFVWLALALAAHAAGDAPFSAAHWFGMDVLWRCGAAMAVGWAIGYAAMRFLFRGGGRAVSRSREGLAALAVTLLVYGTTELLHGYGFLAVFVAALAIRQYERDHDFHETLDTFVVQCERVLMVILLILFGGALDGGGHGHAGDGVRAGLRVRHPARRRAARAGRLRPALAAAGGDRLPGGARHRFAVLPGVRPDLRQLRRGPDPVGDGAAGDRDVAPAAWTQRHPGAALARQQGAAARLSAAVHARAPPARASHLRAMRRTEPSRPRWSGRPAIGRHASACDSSLTVKSSPPAARTT